MRLADLDPRWYSADNNPDIVGVTFDCPHCFAKQRLGVLFVEEIDRDGLPNDVHWSKSEKKWHREGDTFETLTLSPSIDCSHFGHWHGHITKGEVH